MEPRIVKKAFKRRLYPTTEQVDLLARSFGCKRFVYNNAKAFKDEAYKADGTSVSSNTLVTRLVSLKKEFEFLKEVSSVLLQQALRDLDTSYQNFFKKRAAYPQFKSKHAKQSFRLTKAGFSVKDGELFMAKSKEPLSIRGIEDVPLNRIISITISKDKADRYFVSMLCEAEMNTLPISNSTVGIDLGLKDLVIASDGAIYENPRHLVKYQSKLAWLQRKFSRTQKKSQNRNKMRKRIARLHAKIADCRQDYLHKVTRQLVNENQVICMETLRVKNMLKLNTLAKHIADAAWGELSRQLDYKAAWAGRTVSKIDTFFPSSKLCSTKGCDYKHANLTLNVRHWECPKCGALHDRDINASRNIEAAGLAVLACGATGSGLDEAA